MNRYNIREIDGNSFGDVVRCPNCGQVLFVLNGLEGNMKITAQCRRCHRFTEIETTTDGIAEQVKD